MLSKLKVIRPLIAAGLLALPTTLVAQGNAFAPGWLMDGSFSSLQFQSTKNETKVEESQFVELSGSIDSNGLAEVTVYLDSVDTRIDLRNVRMRFLFFETFNFPEAKVTVQLQPDMLVDLETNRQKMLTVPVNIQLHGVEVVQDVTLLLVLLDNNSISVSTATPMTINIADFNFDGGLAKLEEAAKVVILPSSDVTFDLTFHRARSLAVFQTETLGASATIDPSTTANEETGDFTAEACIGRFEILSRTDNITFRSSSARLTPDGLALLDSIAQIIGRCPELIVEIAGHTDSDGGDVQNQQLSEARSASVVSYLVGAGANPESLRSTGYGESRPLVPNTNATNKSRNRRIEFTSVAPD